MTIAKFTSTVLYLYTSTSKRVHHRLRPRFLRPLHDGVAKKPLAWTARVLCHVLGQARPILAFLSQVCCSTHTPLSLSAWRIRFFGSMPLVFSNCLPKGFPSPGADRFRSPIKWRGNLILYLYEPAAEPVAKKSGSRETCAKRKVGRKMEKKQHQAKKAGGSLSTLCLFEPLCLMPVYITTTTAV